MCSSRRFVQTSAFSLVGCCVLLGGYYWFLRATTDGGYTEWSAWSNCTKDCGEGFQTRFRLCSNPAPGLYGKDCFRFGPSGDTKACFLKICPIDGKYSDWTPYSACNKPCGGGKQFRKRQCNNPPPTFGGKPCEGPALEEQDCNQDPCVPVDGRFSDWGPFGVCSVTCGKGEMTRTRTCTNPAPLYGGKPCEGPESETAECNKEACPEGQKTLEAPKPPDNAQQSSDAAENPQAQQTDLIAPKANEKAPENDQKAPDPNRIPE